MDGKLKFNTIIQKNLIATRAPKKYEKKSKKLLVLSTTDTKITHKGGKLNFDTFIYKHLKSNMGKTEKIFKRS